MAEVPRYVVDASVVVRWYLHDEKYVAESLALLDDFAQGRIRLVAPELIRYEVTSAILKAAKLKPR